MLRSSFLVSVLCVGLIQSRSIVDPKLGATTAGPVVAYVDARVSCSKKNEEKRREREREREIFKDKGTQLVFLFVPKNTQNLSHAF